MKIFRTDWNKIQDLPRIGELIKLDFEDDGLKSLKNTFVVTELENHKRGDFTLNMVEVVKVKKNGKPYSYNCYCQNSTILYFDNRPEGHNGWVA